MPTNTGIHHIALTVSDLDTSVRFYSTLWGAEPVATMNDGPFLRRVFALPAGSTLGLTQHDHGSGNPFDATTPGLDHVGFGVAARSDLQDWARHLDEHQIGHSGIVEAPYGAALSFTDPDGVALELFLPA
jgi:glyoxylase I family protein